MFFVRFLFVIWNVIAGYVIFFEKKDIYKKIFGILMEYIAF